MKKKATKAMTTIPPTTPPMMAARGVDLLEPPLLLLPPLFPLGLGVTLGVTKFDPLQEPYMVSKLWKVEAPLLMLPKVTIWEFMAVAVRIDEKVGTIPEMLTRCSLAEVPGLIEYRIVDPSEA
jgi:hypothetical protein